MKKTILLLLTLTMVTPRVAAQFEREITSEDPLQPNEGRRKRIVSDSIQSQHKQIPKGLKTWTVDSRFGEITPVEPDTLSYMFPNTALTTGIFGEYNTTGNLGSPRINRIFIDRKEGGHFIFTDPYDYMYTAPEDFHFTQTYSPLTNLTYFTCGDRTDGEDHLEARFAVNAGKKFGAGFKFKYLYGRGYYANQNTSLLDYTVYASYRGMHYQAHLIASAGQQKQNENGGIIDDSYITHPDSYAEDFTEDEIPTVLSKNWNRNSHQHVFFTHRYSLGFSRRVPLTEDERKARQFAIDAAKEKELQQLRDEAMKQAEMEGREFDEQEFRRQQQQLTGRPDGAQITDKKNTEVNDGNDNNGERITVNSVAEADSLNALIANTLPAEGDTAWTKLEFVPVTSFIHTLELHNHKRIYQAYVTPENFYANEYYNIGKLTGDSIYDKTRHWEVKNTFAVALLEGFNKWAKAGLKAFATYDLRHFALPDGTGRWDKYNESSLSVGGNLSKREGKTLHYDISAEFHITGEDAGEMAVDAKGDVNIPFLRDTLCIEADAFIHREQPSFYMEHYHSRHHWWDNELDIGNHVHLGVQLSYPKTQTRLRAALDRIDHYTYFLHTYTRHDDFTHTMNDISVVQHNPAITVLTLQWAQNFKLGPLHWENVATLQTSSEEKVIGVPAFNLYSNLFVRFRLARVLHCDFGVDVRYFTKYYAPAYIPMIGQYGAANVMTTDEDGTTRVTQEKVGGHPYVNIYANFFLKHTRFFVMLSHVNSDMGSRNYFMTPHYPQNSRALYFGLSWNFFN